MHYNSESINQLTELFSKYGSDKGSSKKSSNYNWTPHTYSDYYYKLFFQNRASIRNLLEVGIGSKNLSIPSNMGESGSPGASLRAWRDFFVNANIYGCDIDPETLFTEERISTFEMDQTNQSSIIKTIGKFGGIDVDIVIDDGLHTFIAGSTLFSNIFYKLSTNGIYIIEDVHFEDLDNYCKFLNNYPVYFYFVRLRRINEPINSDNNLLIISNH